VEGSMTRIQSLKADLHVHSRYSKRPSEWVLRKIGCAESYTEPMRLYAIAKDRGMDLVTITDHNTIDGCLEIAHLPDTFIGEEITTYFPEDGCKLHVLAYGITENQHKDITLLRENVFDLIDYLNKEKIIHSLAHPLYSINDRLAIEHVEQALVLFQNFEINGSRDNYQNYILEGILANLTMKDIDHLAEKYGLDPIGNEPWKKNVTCGSDDHSSLYIATSYTEIDEVGSVNEFLLAIGEQKTKVTFVDSSPRKLAHNLYSIAYQFYNSRFKLNKYLNRDPLLRFIDHALLTNIKAGGLKDRLKDALYYQRQHSSNRSSSNSLMEIFQKEAKKTVFADSQMSSLLKKSKHNPDEMENGWFKLINQLSDKTFKQLSDAILEKVSEAKLFDIFHIIGSAGSLYTIIAPYFVSYNVFTKDRNFCQACLEKFNSKETNTAKNLLNIAHFTDTFYDINGVALTLQKQVEIARKNKVKQIIVTCGPEKNMLGVKNFPPIGTFELPEYPELKLHYPPLLQMLNYCYENHFTHIHSATPGLIGLAALTIARILKIPISATYHTSLPQYTSYLTEDNYMEDLMWKYTLWYYNQMEKIYVPSKATGDELITKGIPEDKIKIFTRGVDLNLFHPSKRNGIFKNRFDMQEKTIKILYVGRISKEKNLPDLVKVYHQLHKIRQGIHFIIVGDGPFMKEMKNALSGLPVTFMGYLNGEDLAHAYASCDIFTFPSSTDTFGNVVLEAQASGIPVVVSDGGGPKENMVQDITGFVAPSGDIDAFTRAVLRLVDNPLLLQKMKQSSRDYMENRSFESAQMQFWNTYNSPIAS
jgi:glycosyltransferase involved in cell wall biosynthesis